MMFRLPYVHRISDFVPKDLLSPQDIDLAEIMFGTVDAVPAIKGRVYFEDARWDGNGGNRFFEHIIPKILSTPKPTSFQHYLVQPLVKPSRGSLLNGAEDKLTLHNWDQPAPGRYEFRNANGDLVATGAGSVIRGHKRYWHKPGTTPREVKDRRARFEANGQGVEIPRMVQGQERWVPSTQHTVIRPVKKDTVFIGRVRFENLSDIELGALLSALQLPPSKRHRHQLGMGKPLGMGSVQIEATLNITQRTGEQSRYVSFFTDDGKFNLGEVSEAQNKKTAEKAKQQFREAMVQHYNSCVTTNRLSDTADLWDIPRLQVLAIMLEWEDPRTQGRTDYEPLGNGRIWRERPVLPTPHEVVGINEPSWGEVTPAGRRDSIEKKDQQQEFNPQKAPVSPSPSRAEADRIKGRIQKLRGKGEVSRMPDIVGRITEITDSVACRECAELLKQWLQKQKLWNKEPHASATWRKQLNDILEQS